MGEGSSEVAGLGFGRRRVSRSRWALGGEKSCVLLSQGQSFLPLWVSDTAWGAPHFFYGAAVAGPHGRTLGKQACRRRVVPRGCTYVPNLG